MARKPQDTSAEEPDGGNLHVRFRGGPGRGNRPGLLNKAIIFALARRLQLSLPGVALALCASGFALAENAPAPDEGQPAETTGALKEIVVTATRHEESLSKVPVSVSAFTQEDMDQKGMKDFTDIVRFTPGVSIDQTGTNAISIRGISSSGGAGTTGIYLDDTPIQLRSLGFNPDATLPNTC